MLWFTKNILSLKKEISVTIISFGNFTQVSNYQKKKRGIYHKMIPASTDVEMMTSIKKALS